MHTLPAYRRILLLTEGRLGVFSSKTAASLLRYRPADIAAVIDSAAAGRPLRDFVPWAPDVPILPDIVAALARPGAPPDALFIGVAPVGGALPADMRPHVLAALRHGLDVVSGMHAFLADDPELRDLAARHGARLIDLRRPPADRQVSSLRALATGCRRVLTVGTDCNVGKMVAALELTSEARRRGLSAEFAATGQTGIMIAGWGITIDACVADFAAGAAESLVLAADGRTAAAATADRSPAGALAPAAPVPASSIPPQVFIEGQGSIAHPGFSAVTLALLHGTCPDALVLVHHAGRPRYNAPPHAPLPPLPQLIAAYERMAEFVHPARVAAIAVNTFGLSAAEAQTAVVAIEAETGLPAADVVRDGAARLLDASLRDGAPPGEPRPPGS